MDLTIAFSASSNTCNLAHLSTNHSTLASRCAIMNSCVVSLLVITQSLFTQLPNCQVKITLAEEICVFLNRLV